MPPGLLWGEVSSWEEPPGQTQEMLDRFLGWPGNTFSFSPENIMLLPPVVMKIL